MGTRFCIRTDLGALESRLTPCTSTLDPPARAAPDQSWSAACPPELAAAAYVRDERSEFLPSPFPLRPPRRPTGSREQRAETRARLFREMLRVYRIYRETGTFESLQRYGAARARRL